MVLNSKPVEEESLAPKTTKTLAPDLTNAGSWASLEPPLRKTTLSTLKRLGMNHMAPVQSATIPLFLTGKDVVVEANTGSGKTLAFVVPIIETLMKGKREYSWKDVGAMVISPTRELATQTSLVLQEFLDDLKKLQPEGSFVPTQTLLIGGTDFDENLQNFVTNGGNIMVGTPGRIEEIIKQSDKAINVKELDVLVLDEADRLFSMGFQFSIEYILGSISKQRRTGLFSATQTKEVKELAKAGMRNPIKVAIKVSNPTLERLTSSSSMIPQSLGNYYVITPLDKKLSHLFSFLSTHKNEKIIVYFLTCSQVDYFFKILRRLQKELALGMYIDSIHGKAPYAIRVEVYKKFLNATSGVLLATDVAARGLDFPAVDWVIQFDPPQDPASFIHRVGRTARMGKSGNALVYLSKAEEGYVDLLLVKGVPSVELEYEEPEDILPRVRSIALKDREIVDKAAKAFVSYIRGYKEHRCSFIFRLPKLDFGLLAAGFGLLRMPIMSELKGKVIEFEGRVENSVYNQIEYENKKRQQDYLRKKERLAEERMLEEESDQEGGGNNKKRKERERGKDNKRKEKETKKETKEQEVEDEDEEDNEIDELKNDEEFLKKIESGQITDAQIEEDFRRFEKSRKPKKFYKKNKRHKSR
eukprot:TRINITY_DN11850_c0_g1_i1.p1 TRINITY_DN11850_c0_g1~~TRINITY_DN11850_c0_g1_i1.p1  ORF type:complete len:700 (-),score=196.66 TRINITY_DN11850_c0_g1_i1:8-1933(-)